MIIRKLRLVTDRAVAGNDNRSGVRHLERPIRRKDHPINTAARRVVDERVEAVEPGITRVQNIRVLEVNGDIGVGVGGLVVSQVQSLAVELERVGLGEGLCG